MRRRIICLLLMVIGTIGLYAQSVSYAQSLINQGRYLDAAKQLRPLADGGNAEAQYLASYLFFHGKGVTKNEQQGVKYATLAANQGNEDAVVLMADYYSGNGNNEKAYQLLEKYVSLLNAWKGTLGARYAESLINGEGCEKDVIRGYQLMELGGSTNSPGWKYLTAHAKEYLETMASQNDMSVPNYVIWKNNEPYVSRFVYIELAKKQSFDLNKIDFDIFMLASNSTNNHWAKYFIGKFLEEGLGTEKDPASAKLWYKRAKEAGNVCAIADYIRMDERYWVGEQFEEGYIFWVSNDGKTATVMSRKCRVVDCNGGRQWAKQSNGWWLPRKDELVHIVAMRKKIGEKVAGCYWSGNLLCQFDDKGNMIRTYDINAIPPSLGRYHNCYLEINIGKK